MPCFAWLLGGYYARVGEAVAVTNDLLFTNPFLLKQMIQNIISGKQAEMLMKKIGVVAMDISDRFIDIYLKDSSSIDIIPITTFELQYIHTIYLPTDILPNKYSQLKNKKE